MTNTTIKTINKNSGRNFSIVKEIFLRKDSAVGELINANTNGLVVAIYEPCNECLRFVDGKMYYAYDNGVLETKFHHRDFYDMKNTFHNMADQMSMFYGFRMFILEETTEETVIEVVEEQQPVAAEAVIEESVSNDVPVELIEVAVSAVELTNRESVYDSWYNKQAIYILDKNNDIHRIRRNVYTFTSHGIVKKEILSEERMLNKIADLLDWQDINDFRFFSVIEK
ncbi:MAG: hypothetical protein ACLT40_00520 [Fusobacterium sp.]